MVDKTGGPGDGLVFMLTALIYYFSSTHSLILIMVSVACHYFLGYKPFFFCRNWIRYVAFDIFFFQKNNY